MFKDLRVKQASRVLKGIPVWPVLRVRTVLRELKDLHKPALKASKEIRDPKVRMETPDLRGLLKLDLKAPRDHLEIRALKVPRENKVLRDPL